MEINERFIKLSSRIPYPKEIQLDSDITVVIDGQAFIANCVKIEDRSNQDGTIDKIYNLKFLAE